MEAILKRYTSYLANNKNLSSATLSAYRRDVELFFARVQCEFDAVTTEAVAGYITEMRASGRADATILRTMASLRSFYAYLERRKLVKVNPVKEVETPKIDKKLPRVMSIKEVDALLAQPAEQDVKSIRDKAMLEVLYATGIRVSELIGLKLENINMRRNFIVCTHGYKTRNIPLGKMAVDALKKYLKSARPVLLNDKNETALFVNYKGRAMTRQGFWKMIKKYALEAGIKTDITPHTLRHSFASHLLQNGADLQSIQEMMGFVDISSTNIYTRIMENKIANVYKNAHPRA